MRENRSGVEKDSVPSNWLDDRHACVHQLFAEIEHLTDAASYVVFLHRFLNSDRDCFHVAAGEPAIGMQSFVQRYEISRLVGQIVIAQREPSSDVDETVFLCRHRHSIGEVAHIHQY